MRPINPALLSRDNAKEPEFNQAIEYQKAIRTLLNQAHFAMVREEYELAYKFAIECKIEAYPRKPALYKKDVLPHERIAKGIYFSYNNDRLTKLNFMVAMESFLTYLNGYLHACGLIMPDKADQSEGVDVV